MNKFELKIKEVTLGGENFFVDWKFTGYFTHVAAIVERLNVAFMFKYEVHEVK